MKLTPEAVEELLAIEFLEKLNQQRFHDVQTLKALFEHQPNDNQVAHAFALAEARSRQSR